MARIHSGFYVVAAVGLAVFLVALNISEVVAKNDEWKQWEVIDVMQDREVMDLIFDLKHSNLDFLEDVARRVSNPKHPSYGKYLSQSELSMLVKPTDSMFEAVESWAQSRRLGPSTRQWDSVTIPVTAEVFDRDWGFRPYRCENYVTGEVRFCVDLMATFPSFLNPYVHGVRGWIKRYRLLDTVSSSTTTPSSTVSVMSSGTQCPVYGAIAGFTNQPFVIDVVTGPSAVQSMTVMITCKDGSVPRNVSTMQCSSISNSPVTIIATAAGYSGTFVTSSVVSIAENVGNCQYCGDLYGSLYNTSFMAPNAACCQLSFHFLHFPLFVPVQVKVATQFADNSVTIAQPVISTCTGDDFEFLYNPYRSVRGVKDLYNVPHGIRVSRNSTTQGVPEFGQEYYSPADLTAFFNAMGIRVPSDIVTVVGDNDYANATGPEATLDIEFIMGIAPGAPTTFWTYQGSDFGQFITWGQEITGMATPPQVVSISYGFPEFAVSPSDATRLEAYFQMLATRGVSVLVSAGDSGAFEDYDDSSQCAYTVPNYPTSSPWVTSVGGTVESAISSAFTQLPFPEVEVVNSALYGDGSYSCGGITSGGGLSSLFSIPDYQLSMVTAYANYMNATNFGLSTNFNLTGRGYPDLTAISAQILTVQNNQISPISGTSASAPITAGMITLVNDARAQLGSPPLGFLNPLLYALAVDEPAVFTDVTFGDNRALEASSSAPFTHLFACPYGFEALVGWDAVSGLGSLSFDFFFEATVTAPTPAPAPSASPSAGSGTCSVVFSGCH